MNFIGIDPGLKGAIAVIRNAGPESIIEIHDMPPAKGYPEPSAVLAILEPIFMSGPCIVVTEMTSTRPFQGIQSAHNYGIGFGVLLGVVSALRPKRFLVVRPQVWQKVIWERYGGHGDDTKVKTFQSVCRAWPQMIETLRPGKAIMDGRSDALAMAEYVRMMEASQCNAQ